MARSGNADLLFHQKTLAPVAERNLRRRLHPAGRRSRHLEWRGGELQVQLFIVQTQLQGSGQRLGETLHQQLHRFARLVRVPFEPHALQARADAAPGQDHVVVLDLNPAILPPGRTQGLAAAGALPGNALPRGLGIDALVLGLPLLGCFHGHRWRRGPKPLVEEGDQQQNGHGKKHRHKEALLHVHLFRSVTTLHLLLQSTNRGSRDQISTEAGRTLPRAKGDNASTSVAPGEPP